MAEQSVPLSAFVRIHRGRPALFVNDRLVQPVFYALTDYPGGRWTWEEMPRRNLQLFADQGFSLFQVDLMLEQLWMAPNAFAIDLARNQIRGVIDVCPRAAVVIRLHVNSPPWWNTAHPQECVAYADGPVDAPPTQGIERPLDRDLERALRQSLASECWKEEAGAKVRELCHLLSRTPEGNSLIGMHIANGVFGEWSYFGFIKHEPDTGPAMTAYFRRWLRRKYDHDAALKAAWADDAATLEAADVPGLVARQRTFDGVFRDPARERPVIDYVECQQEATAESLLFFCGLLKESWPRAILAGVFYGYLFSQFGRQAAGGHLAIARVLESPQVDYLSGPQTYQPYTRGIGGTGQSRGLLESCAVHGKLWLDEMDQPTHRGSFGDPGFSCSLPDAVALLRRNVLHPLLRGHGLWYYDFGPRFSSGWWDDPVLIAEIRRIKGIFDQRLESDYESPADVLFLADAAVFCHTGHSFAADPVSEPALDQCSAAMYRSGVVFHMAWLFDLERIDLARYRTVLFTNTWVLTERQKDVIAHAVARDGKTVVWVYAPGYSDGMRLSPEFIAKLIGMRVVRIECSRPPRAEGLAGMHSVVTPLFSPVEGDAEIIARFAETGLPAIARKRGRDCTSWFCSLPPTSPALLRRIFRESGAHVYEDADDVIIAGWGLLCIHTLEGGRRSLALRCAKTVHLDLPPRSTTLIDAGSGAVLIQGSDLPA